MSVLFDTPEPFRTSKERVDRALEELSREDEREYREAMERIKRQGSSAGGKYDESSDDDDDDDDDDNDDSSDEEGDVGDLLDKARGHDDIEADFEAYRRIRERISADVDKVTDVSPEKILEDFTTDYEEHTLMDEMRMLQKARKDEEDRKAGKWKCTDIQICH